jgi:hypothetical protein
MEAEFPYEILVTTYTLNGVKTKNSLCQDNIKVSSCLSQNSIVATSAVEVQNSVVGKQRRYSFQDSEVWSCIIDAARISRFLDEVHAMSLYPQKLA